MPAADREGCGNRSSKAQLTPFQPGLQLHDAVVAEQIPFKEQSSSTLQAAETARKQTDSFNSKVDSITAFYFLKKNPALHVTAYTHCASNSILNSGDAPTSS